METEPIQSKQERRRRNQHFTFKRFHVDQTECAMKVSSDACLFGAYVPMAAARRVLDIGTGTGLLAMMVAQRAPAAAMIDAIEIDPRAAQTAARNVAASPFALQIQVIPGAIQDFMTIPSVTGAPPAPPAPQSSYDMIIANPPFYQKSLRSKVPEHNLAWHADPEGLDFKALLAAVDRLLDPEGVFWVLLPAGGADSFILRARIEKNLYEQQRLEICQRPGQGVYRIISCLGRRPTECLRKVLVRCEADGTVSQQERELLRDYMLHY